MASFAHRLLEQRQKKGITQKELGDHLSVTDAAVGMWERGKRIPDPSILQRLADYFNVSVDYLLGRTDDPRPGQNRSPIEEEWPEVVNVLRRSGKKPTPEDRRRIARIIKAAIEDTDEE